MITIKNDRIVAASNFDIEIYGIITSTNTTPTSNRSQRLIENSSVQQSNETNESKFKIRELKRFLNAHKDSITVLENISGKMN